MERAGTGNGRIYTLVYTATDAAGNLGSKAGFTLVAHDQSGMVDPIMLSVAETASGTVIDWNPVVSGAGKYDVIRGELSRLTQAPAVIKLGAVVCVEDDSPNPSTKGSEDTANPSPGQAFFYLVEYLDEMSSSYGMGSASRPRAPGVGACP